MAEFLHTQYLQITPQEFRETPGFNRLLSMNERISEGRLCYHGIAYD